jgi:hypothetical protein
MERIIKIRNSQKQNLNKIIEEIKIYCTRRVDCLDRENGRIKYIKIQCLEHIEMNYTAFSGRIIMWNEGRIRTGKLASARSKISRSKSICLFSRNVNSTVKSDRTIPNNNNRSSQFETIKRKMYYVIYIYIYIYNRNWVDTRWQQYIKHLHTNNTHNTEKGKLGSAGRAPSLRVILWHLPYNWGKSTDKPQLG